MALIKRLKLIETCISLEDHALIHMQLPLLKKLSTGTNTDKIIELLKLHEYILALDAIKQYLATNQSLMTYEDFEMNALRLELQQVELTFQELMAQRNEACNKCADFNREYHLYLSDILVRILSIKEDIAAQKVANNFKTYRQLYLQLQAIHEQINNKKPYLHEIDEKLNQIDFMSDGYAPAFDEYQCLKNEIDALEQERERLRLLAYADFIRVKADETFDSFREAADEADSFEQETANIKQSVVAELTSEGKKQLKSLYRKACKLSHPDIVSDELKELAHFYMVEINAAYASNDIKRLETVLQQIETGESLTSSSLTLLDKTLLQEKLEKLKKNIQDIQAEIEQYQASDEYHLIFNLGDDWQSYFDEMRIELATILQALEDELAQLLADSATPYEHHLSDDENDENNEAYFYGEHHVNGFWRQGHWRCDIWVRGHWVNSHTRCR